MDRIDEILVIFKTHLDIGFTGLSADIIEKYNKFYIPQAIKLGEELQGLNRPEGFTWTTGSWLIKQYLEQSSSAEHERMCNAIENRNISWHGLPFTMHSEYADAGLYRHGLSFAKQLDSVFNKKTIAAKNTDVPGATRSIVPHLFDYGINFLHCGVNPAASAPNVPDIFRWECPNGQDVVVMYNKGDYGEFTIIPGTRTAIYFAHTGDNMGPQSTDGILNIYDKLHKKYPQATITAGDLNDVAKVVLGIKSTLPIITSEIGDTWIHGIGTDPKKTSQFRALLRMAQNSEDTVSKGLYEHLIMIPEHTWGLDEKSFLGEYQNYRRDLFDKVRSSKNYLLMEESWEEQRGYITSAINSLPPEPRKTAGQFASEYEIEYPEITDYEVIKGNTVLNRGWTITINKDGLLTGLKKDGCEFINKQQPFGQFLYEAFSENEISGYMGRYLKSDEEWAIKDNSKIGLSKEISDYCSFSPICSGVYMKENEIIVLYNMNDDAVNLYGAPPRLVLKIAFEDHLVKFDFAWFNKPANRSPEACWFYIATSSPLTAISKLGKLIDPLDVVSGGNREMHGTDGLLRFNNIDIHTYDAALVSIARPNVYGFHNELPETDKGVWVNLFNNQWGTNFPMWNSGNARFRFSINLNTASAATLVH